MLFSYSTLLLFSCENQIEVNALGSIELPSLTDIPVSEKETLELDFKNNLTNNDKDTKGSAISYQCIYDLTVDNIVAGPVDCTDIDGLTFDENTGLLQWTLSKDAFENGDVTGRYEFKVIATSKNSSDEEVFVVSAINVPLTCPDNFIKVPANEDYEVEEFCVAKYEMKIAGNLSGFPGDAATDDAVSQVAGKPWRNITRDDAISACQRLGPEYNLISNSQWQVIARNIELTPSNWSSGLIGSGFLNSGHADASPAETCDAAEEYVETDCSNSGLEADYIEKRTNTLSNGEEIWDLGGNIREWVRDDITGVEDYGIAGFVATLPAINPNSSDFGDSKFAFGPSGDYSALAAPKRGGLGFYYLKFVGNVIERGGYYNDDVSGIIHAGIFRTDLDYSTSTAASFIGFRCVYEP